MRYTILTSVCLVLLCQSTQAQERIDGHLESSREQAKAFFEQGITAYSEGRFAEAADAFSKAYDALPDTRVLANIAVCLDKAGKHEEAIRAYRRYLAAPVDDPRNDQYRKRLAELEALRPLSATSEPPPSPPVVSVIAPDTNQQEAFSIRAGFWIASALAVACGAGVAVTGALTLQKKDDYEASHRLDTAAKDTGENLRLVTNVLIGSTSLSSAVAIALLIADAKRHRETSPSAHIHLTTTGVSCSW